MTDIAKLITIDTQRHTITIDGIVFPWLIANLDTDAAPAIDLGGILALRVGILADQVVVTNGDVKTFQLPATPLGGGGQSPSSSGHGTPGAAGGGGGDA